MESTGEGTRVTIPLVDEDPGTRGNLTPKLQHIRRPQEKPRSITRSPEAMVDGGPSSSLGSPTSGSHPLNSFAGILAGRADHHNNFHHRGFCSTWVPTDAHSVGVGACMRVVRAEEYESKWSFTPTARGTTHQLVEVR